MLNRKLLVLSVMTSHDGYSKYLYEQLKQKNIEYKILGYGQSWQGWKWRNSLLIDELHKIDDKYVVAIIDSYDVVILEDEKTILEKFQSVNKSIVLTINYHNDNRVMKTLFRLQNRTINAGVMLGKPKQLLKLLQSVHNNEHEYDDEQELNKYIDKHGEKILEDIYIDEQCKFSLNSNAYLHMFPLYKQYNIQEEKVNKFNSSFLHTPGAYYSHYGKINKKWDINSLQTYSLIPFVFLVFIIMLLVSIK